MYENSFQFVVLEVLFRKLFSFCLIVCITLCISSCLREDEPMEKATLSYPHLEPSAVYLGRDLVVGKLEPANYDSPSGVFRDTIYQDALLLPLGTSQAPVPCFYGNRTFYTLNSGILTSYNMDLEEPAKQPSSHSVVPKSRINSLLFPDADRLYLQAELWDSDTQNYLSPSYYVVARNGDGYQETGLEAILVLAQDGPVP